MNVLVKKWMPGLKDQKVYITIYMYIRVYITIYMCIHVYVICFRVM